MSIGDHDEEKPLAGISKLHLDDDFGGAAGAQDASQDGQEPAPARAAGVVEGPPGAAAEAMSGVGTTAKRESGALARVAAADARMLLWRIYSQFEYSVPRFMGHSTKPPARDQNGGPLSFGN